MVVPVIGMCATALSAHNSPPRPFGRELLLYGTQFWAVLVALVIGAMGSSEERQLGVNEAQALLPISVFKQWRIKAVYPAGTRRRVRGDSAA